jgi:hypothetical protein
MPSCKKHPKYKGIRKPRIDCKECHEYYKYMQSKKGYFGWIDDPKSAVVITGVRFICRGKDGKIK